MKWGDVKDVRSVPYHEHRAAVRQAEGCLAERVVNLLRWGNIGLLEDLLANKSGRKDFVSRAINEIKEEGKWTGET